MRAVLWCNGNSPGSSIIDSVISNEVTVFGVDGGADRASEAGITVEEALGDLDSIGDSSWEGLTSELPNQKSSDLAKSLSLLISRGFDEIDVIGADGGDPAHILGSWAAMNDAPYGAIIRIHHESGVTTRVHPEDGEYAMEVKMGEPFSVFSLEPGNVWISGAKWEIFGDFLGLSTRGIHNEGIGEKVTIRGEGVLAIISMRIYSSS